MRVRLPCLKNINLGQFQGKQVKSTLSKALNPLKVRGDIQQMTRISTKKDKLLVFIDLLQLKI